LPRGPAQPARKAGTQRIFVQFLTIFDMETINRLAGDRCPCPRRRVGPGQKGAQFRVTWLTIPCSGVEMDAARPLTRPDGRGALSGGIGSATASVRRPMAPMSDAAKSAWLSLM
jgi:hypothetical protein